jgi:DNA polymerase-3 subunit delta'
MDLNALSWAGPVRAAISALRRRGAHAVLIHGPEGIGKFETAMYIAREELCEQSRGRHPACSQCPSCHLFAAGNHPDLKVLVPDSHAWRRPGGSTEDDAAAGAGEDDAAAGAPGKKRASRELRIEQVRELSRFEGLTTHRAGMRIVVLGPAESLNAPAANALLKGLEEPPPDTLFLLTSDHLDRCLPTIVSRCAAVGMAVPPREQALAWLEQQGHPEAAARLVEAGGAPLLLLRQGEEQLSEEDREILLSLLRRGPRLDAAEVASKVPRSIALGPAIAQLQRWGWDYFAHQMAGRLRYHPDDGAAFGEIAAAGWTLASNAAWLDRLRELRTLADHPLNARLAVEGALLDYIASQGGRGRT